MDALHPWLTAVLHQNPLPGWLQGDAPYNDVALSSRVRIQRNLAGFPFPHRCSRTQLEQIEERVRSVARTIGLKERRNVSEVERAILVGSRLISKDFVFPSPGRCVFFNSNRTLAVMVNEEDHIRMQAIVGGFALEAAEFFANSWIEQLSGLKFASNSKFGYLAASPLNTGAGKRMGVMLHLPGLAAFNKIEVAIRELLDLGFEVRGLLGETSIGTGGYLQISTTGIYTRKHRDRVWHLMNRERKFRSHFGEKTILERTEYALKKLEDSEALSPEVAIRSLGWLRLGALLGFVPMKIREVDMLLTLVQFREGSDPSSNRKRSELLGAMVRTLQKNQFRISQAPERQDLRKHKLLWNG